MLGFLTALQLLLTVQVPALMSKVMMFLTGETGTTKLDVSMVEEVMDIVVAAITKFVTLFTIWPLNLFLILGLISMAIGFFFTAKRGARR